MSTQAGNEVGGKNRPTVVPLRKKNPQNQTYLRDKSVEARIIEVLALEPQQVLNRTMIEDTSDPDFVPSECLLHLVRNSRGTTPSHQIEQLYKALMARVLRSLPADERSGGERVSLTDCRIREAVFDRFVELVVKDRSEYCEKLDFYEVKFNMALKRLRLTAEEKAWKEENRKVPLEYEDGTGEILAEVEQASGSFNPFDPAEMDDEYYRSRLPGAINSLPDEQKTIIDMIQKGIPIDSKDPGAVTIARTLGKSEKTIRSHRNQAFQALETMLKGNKPL